MAKFSFGQAFRGFIQGRAPTPQALRDASRPHVWQPAPAPAIDLGIERALGPGPRFNPMVGHSHLYRPQPFPGAPAYAFETLGLAEFSFIGPAVANRRQLNVISPHPTAFSSLGLKTQGLGGLVQGQIFSAPLIVPDAFQGEPSPDSPIADNWIG